MKLIPLTQGKFCQVDDADFDFLNQWKWGLLRRKHTCYAKRSYWKDGKSYTVKMHRLLLGLTDPNILGEHRDHNGLNNQRYNLRTCTQAENVRNKTSQKGSTSKYLGVSLYLGHKGANMYWRAGIRTKDKRICVGYFPCTDEGEIKAAKAYNLIALQNHGEFANINILP